MSNYHNPVLLNECIDALQIQPDGVYVDVTFGGGGHSKEILKHLNENGKLIGFDRDAEAIANSINDSRFQLAQHDYRWISNFLEYFQAVPVNGILADLGVSSHQLNAGERGFSFRQEAALDLRMDRDIGLSAADVLNTYNQSSLQTIFGKYGEIKNAKTLADAVISYRSNKPVKSTFELVEIVEGVLRKADKKSKYLAMVFQALRIEVNDELKSVELLLESIPNVLGNNGKFVCITYHSLEDRLVKNFINKGNVNGKEQKDFYGKTIKPLNAVNRKPILPSEEEIEMNPRARSAKLRIAEKTHE